MNALQAWYAGLQAREQRMLAWGAVVLAALSVVGGILLPLHAAVSAANRARETQTQDLAWMRLNAPEVLAGAGALAPDTHDAPVVLVDRVGRELGLGAALRGTQPSGTGVRVQLEAAPFDGLVTWLATLDERYGLGIDAISLDRAGKPGVVNANVTFAPARR